MLQALEKLVYGETFKDELLREYAELTRHTRDYSYLQQRQWHWLFVHDELKHNHRDNEVIRDSSDGPSWATGYTVEKYKMWKKTLGKASFPVPLAARPSDHHHGWFENEDNPQVSIAGELALKTMAPAARIRGELYLTSAEGIAELDRRKENRVQFARQRIRVIVPYREVVWTRERPEGYQRCIVLSPPRHYVIDAWGYVGIEDYWNKELDYQYSPVRTFLPKLKWLGRYYDFTQMEYKDFF